MPEPFTGVTYRHQEPKDGAADVYIARSNKSLGWYFDTVYGDRERRTYSIYFGEDSNPPLLAMWDPPSAGGFQLPFRLDYGRTYYWRVVTHVGEDGSSWPSPLWHFTTEWWTWSRDVAMGDNRHRLVDGLLHEGEHLYLVSASPASEAWIGVELSRPSTSLSSFVLPGVPASAPQRFHRTEYGDYLIASMFDDGGTAKPYLYRLSRNLDGSGDLTTLSQILSEDCRDSEIAGAIETDGGDPLIFGGFNHRHAESLPGDWFSPWLLFFDAHGEFQWEWKLPYSASARAVDAMARHDGDGVALVLVDRTDGVDLVYTRFLESFENNNLHTTVLDESGATALRLAGTVDDTYVLAETPGGDPLIIRVEYRSRVSWAAMFEIESGQRPRDIRVLHDGSVLVAASGDDYTSTLLRITDGGVLSWSNTYEDFRITTCMQDDDHGFALAGTMPGARFRYVKTNPNGEFRD